MAEHGTRTMYVHYGCRCDECCKAEHRQYLKRKEAQQRKRTYSKWGEEFYQPARTESKRKYSKKRYNEIKETGLHTRPIRWTQIASIFNNKCAICGSEVNPEDKWRNENGRLCFGRSYPTVDHIVPLEAGGTDTFDNVQLACKRCNSKKGARLDYVI